jgi:predicted RNA-binding Zn ribbon-like protein
LSGERDARRQPGGRAPAPGTLALVQAFINTHFDLGTNWGADVLGSPSALGEWLIRHELLDRGVPILEEDLRRALRAREALRALADVEQTSVPATLDEVAAGAAVEVRFGPSGPRFVRSEGTGVAGALGLILALAARAMIDGSWARLKICPGDHCGWAFYDNSRNQTGRWCSMSVCGGRAKARAHYRRRRDVGT